MHVAQGDRGPQLQITLCPPISTQTGLLKTPPIVLTPNNYLAGSF